MEPETTPAVRSVFAERNFMLLFGGSSISALGDQFTLVALPWLVLKLTGDAAALGLVLAAMALPRALFMLLGGAVVDRLSPRRVLLAARTVNAALIGLLTVLVLSGHVHMAAVYVIALGIGLATAFVYPAGSSLIPRILSPQQLASGNALTMGARQLSMFVGPGLAGLVIALGAHAGHGGTADSHGLGLAFAIDTVSFLFSLASLSLIRLPDEASPGTARRGVFAELAEGVRTAWNDVPLRAFMLYAGAVTILVGGPVQVGLPMLADTRLDMGAASLGILMTANGGGMLVGAALSPRVVRRLQGRLGLMVLMFDSLVGLALAGLSQVHGTATGALLLATVGLFAGLVQVGVISWIQQRAPRAMLGRIMSIVIFIFMGVGPISAAAAGSLLKVIDLSTLFLGAGLSLSIIALSCMTSPALRAIGAPDRPGGADAAAPAVAAPERVVD